MDDERLLAEALRAHAAGGVSAPRPAAPDPRPGDGPAAGAADATANGGPDAGSDAGPEDTVAVPARARRRFRPLSSSRGAVPPATPADPAAASPAPPAPAPAPSAPGPRGGPAVPRPAGPRPPTGPGGPRRDAAPGRPAGRSPGPPPRGGGPVPPPRRSGPPPGPGAAPVPPPPVATRVGPAPTVVTRPAAGRSPGTAAADGPATPWSGGALRARTAALGAALAAPWTPVRVAWWAGGAVLAGGSVGAVGGILTLLLAG